MRRTISSLKVDSDFVPPPVKRSVEVVEKVRKGENYFKGRQLSADSNHHSYVKLALCRAEGLEAYIPDLQFRKRDQRFAGQPRFKDGIHPRKRAGKQGHRQAGLFTKADFLFDETERAYRCPQGRLLRCGAREQPNLYRMYDMYCARQEDCATCRLRPGCLSGPSTPRRNLSVRMDVQWRLFALVYNIGKIHTYGRVI